MADIGTRPIIDPGQVQVAHSRSSAFPVRVFGAMHGDLSVSVARSLAPRLTWAADLAEGKDPDRPDASSPEDRRG